MIRLPDNPRLSAGVFGILVAMSKKKRTKTYKGNTAVTRPVITRVSAVNRNQVSQWWFDHKQFAKPVAIVVGIALVIIIIIIGLIDIIF